MSVDSPARISAPGQAAPPGTRPRPAGWQALRPLLLRLHFYAGVLVAPFLLVAALTGALYAAAQVIERIVYADVLHVSPGESRVPLGQQVTAALDARPGGELAAVWVADEPGETTRVLLDHPDADAGRQLAVFVDPYTTEITGTLSSYGGAGALPFRAWVSELHANLGLGEPGRFYSELAASWLWVVVLGGLALWFARRRKQRALRGTRGQRRLIAWHGTLGVWVALGLLVLSATGLTWSRWAGENIGELRAQLGGTRPTLDTSGSGSAGGHEEHTGGGGSSAADGVGLDRVLATARTGEGLSGPLNISVPPTAADGTPGAYLVRQADRQVPQRLDQIAVDATTGEVTGRLAFADYPVLVKLTSWGIGAHDGSLFGLVNQIVLFGLALATVVTLCLGYRMWWRRRPPPAGRLALGGRPPARGTWRRLPPRLLLPLVAVTVAVSWYVPLLGLTLVAFLAVDATLGALARRRAARPAAPASPEPASPAADGTETGRDTDAVRTESESGRGTGIG
ncbi:PepSY domain-containing protein [Streptomyces sp. JJ66]|uniref:PepSY-associated TM helix domain-containing protein n=1 Tax=Streptomyces sp. JJ66 TaxID=2803843 RepID=UPI001C55FB3D|nr:PepSY-associated TM helix domain-containing protein [Streptomyces sp. JJ66]MBW1604534.1 PepSY domain-containing protein [Streptomyces sp. JJ66]